MKNILSQNKEKKDEENKPPINLNLKVHSTCCSTFCDSLKGNFLSEYSSPAYWYPSPPDLTDEHVNLWWNTDSQVGPTSVESQLDLCSHRVFRVYGRNKISFEKLRKLWKVFKKSLTEVISHVGQHFGNCSYQHCSGLSD